MHTIPVDPSPIFMKFSRESLGSPGLTTICKAARNCSWERLGPLLLLQEKLKLLEFYIKRVNCYLPGFLMSGYKSFYLCAAIAVESLGEEPDPLSTES